MAKLKLKPKVSEWELFEEGGETQKRSNAPTTSDSLALYNQSREKLKGFHQFNDVVGAIDSAYAFRPNMKMDTEYLLPSYYISPRKKDDFGELTNPPFEGYRVNSPFVPNSVDSRIQPDSVAKMSNMYNYLDSSYFHTYNEGLGNIPLYPKPKGRNLPKKKHGGENKPIYTSDPKDPRLQAYNDSLFLYNNSKLVQDYYKNKGYDYLQSSPYGVPNNYIEVANNAMSELRNRFDKRSKETGFFRLGKETKVPFLYTEDGKIHYTDDSNFLERMTGEGNEIYGRDAYNKAAKNLMSKVVPKNGMTPLIDMYNQGFIDIGAPVQYLSPKIKPSLSIGVSGKGNRKGNYDEVFTYDLNTIKPTQEIIYKKQLDKPNYQPTEIVERGYRRFEDKNGTYDAKWEKDMWGKDYERKHPPIYVNDPHDESIGWYTAAGNEIRYKPQSHKPTYQDSLRGKPLKLSKMDKGDIDLDTYQPDLQLSEKADYFPKGTFFTRERQSGESGSKQFGRKGKKDYFDKKTGKLIGSYKKGGMVNNSEWEIID